MERKSILRVLLFSIVVGLALAAMWSMASAGPVVNVGNWITLSGRAVILQGETFDTVSFPTPACPAGSQFLILGLQVGPEFIIGSTGTDVVNLGKWGAAVAVSQRSTGGAVTIPFTLLADGPVSVSGQLPAGQKSLGSTSVSVRVSLLGGVPAAYRFEFNVHVTGACGTPYVIP